jgi:tetratricopeptide (TPR) repeat protein
MRVELVPEADHFTVMPIAFLRGLKAVYGRRPIEAVLDTVIAAHGVEQARRLYYDLLRSEPQEYNFSEPQLNRIGYRLLRSDRAMQAIEIFRLNAERFPLSSNVYDSLGEAYMAAGDHARAIESYRRSLELDPANDNAVEMLRRLGASTR